ncbi:alpha/beta fold hydrolase [Pseudomonas sp. SMV7]|uniref:alpha/beta fold hydrolase n=1 Tax=Pseudomonas sp. SMV7 TaxID=3390194 RepID=UPI003F848F01
MKAVMKIAASSALYLALVSTAVYSGAPSEQVSYRTLQVSGFEVFYREAGPHDAPTVLLLHGFPTSSHMFRELIPKLAVKYHVIAPDLPGFGFTQRTGNSEFDYTFDNLTKIIDGFIEAKGLSRFAMYVFDYGAPVGWRIAAAHPQKISALISQNGNAYEEGLSDGWAPIQTYWANPTQQNRLALRKLLELKMTKWQYMEGVKETYLVSPDGYTLDQALLEREGQQDIQLDLFLDYASNVKKYPEFHNYFRKHQPPLLAIWGKNDPFFLPAGAQAFKRDIPKAEVSLIENTGHFALETHSSLIADKILDFLNRNSE